MMRSQWLLLVLFAGCGSPAASPIDDAGVPDLAVDLAPSTDDASADEGAAFAATELLGRPTSNSITVSLVPALNVEAFAEFGAQASGVLDHQTPPVMHAQGQPFTLVLDGLSADTAYFYRVRWRLPGDAVFQSGLRRSFHTQRPPGATFRFTMQADSHLDENSDLDLYRRTLANVSTDAADFHVDLGDTFMCEKHSAPLTATILAAPDPATVDARYLYERGNFDLIAHSIPLFLVNGNHDGELGFLRLGMGNDLPTWATLARHRFYLNPVPDTFYSGDSQVDPVVGERASWYSFRWGDALFVALDPFWDTTVKSSSDGWVWTLGDRQFHWLEQTLAASDAKWKFVFLHNLVGGLDGQMRGGIEAAPFYEWGGQNTDGSMGFAAKRPGWDKPIRQVLVDGKVTAVFHGHDHLYAKQDLDGIVYQEVPQPSARNTMSGASLATTYHYAAGTILSSTGHLRVTVAPTGVTAEYVRAWLPAQETAQHKNAEIADAWSIKAQ